MRSRRATAGRVIPCSTSVQTITEKASHTNNDRGYAAWFARSGGSPRAAARVTTSRIPAQAITVGTRTGGAGSRSRTRRANRAK